MSDIFYDSVGNDLRDGDIVRMYHFTGARNRRHFMYKRFAGYHKSNKGDVYGKWHSLDDKDHWFADHSNQFKNITVVVQRKKYHEENLKRSSKWRD